MPNKIAKEVAEKEFEKLCVSRRIETDITTFNEREKAIFNARKADMLRLMMAGTLVLNEQGDPVYTPSLKDAKPLTFHRVTGAVLMEADNITGSVERLLVLATALTKSVPGELAKLEAPEFRAIDDITAFLVGR
ncbi:MAG TPA: hypothetical protein VJN18_32855 [Polyangiaceae bacterium]|nr:hypothetical protein [Polyangiaceae bacterium]